MKVLLLGAGGQLGHELHGPLGCFAEVTALRHADLDLADGDALRNTLARHQPQLIVNAAAYTNVDGAEDEPEVAHAVNAMAPGILASWAGANRCGLIHVSTDFVFDGAGEGPYDEQAATEPINTYGKSKLAGEQAILASAAAAIVLRTSWVYSLRRRSFVSMMLQLARERSQLKVVTDQVGSPTWCRDLAQTIALLCHRMEADPERGCREAGGVYHLAGSGSASRYELVQAALAEAADLLDPVELIPVQASAFPQKAPRPMRTPLACGKFERRFALRLAPWRHGLRRAIADLGTG